MSEKPNQAQLLSELNNALREVEDAAEKASDIASKLDEGFPEEVWAHAASELAASLTISCDATMDGGVLVELIDESGAIIKKHAFSLIEVFERSTFSCGSEQARQDLIAAAKQVLAFAEQIKVQE